MSCKETYNALSAELRQIRLAVAPLIRTGNQHGEEIGQHINRAEGLLVRLNSDLCIERGDDSRDDKILKLERELRIARTALEKALPVIRQYEE